MLEREDRTYFAPGSGYRYSDTGYSLLSLMVANASGEGFAAFLRERIFQPLGMHDTLAYEEGIPSVPHRAFGYSFEHGAWQRTDQSLTSAVLGDGGIYSSIADLAKWDAALYGTRPLDAASLQLAFTPHTATDDAMVRYGFGWRITGSSVWHSGETLGFRNVIVRWPRRHFTVIVLTNRNDPEPYTLALAIARACLPDIDADAGHAGGGGPGLRGTAHSARKPRALMARFAGDCRPGCSARMVLCGPGRSRLARRLPALVDPDWTARQPPFLIYGNTYYVGTRGLSSILITSAAGHVLIDGTVQEGAAQVRRISARSASRSRTSA